MKKIILTGGLMLALTGMLSLQSCNSENKEATTDTTQTDTMAMDTMQMPVDTVAIDTGMKGTKVPIPK